MNIVIIGGSRGIGLAAAKELQKDGHRLLLTGRDAGALISAKETLLSGPEGEVFTFPMDITKEEDTKALVKYLVEQKFPVDGLVLNAAKFPDPRTKCSVIQPAAEELEEILRTNVVGHYRVVQSLLPGMQPGGRIILIGSTSGIRQDKGGIYGISKWALRSYAYNLREECKSYGIGVSLIHPGGTFTETRKKQGPEDTSLLETSDLGILIATAFRLSGQAVIEELSIRPVTGDTY